MQLVVSEAQFTALVRLLLDNTSEVCSATFEKKKKRYPFFVDLNKNLAFPSLLII